MGFSSLMGSPCGIRAADLGAMPSAARGQDYALCWGRPLVLQPLRRGRFLRDLRQPHDPDSTCLSPRTRLLSVERERQFSTGGHACAPPQPAPPYGRIVLAHSQPAKMPPVEWPISPWLIIAPALALLAICFRCGTSRGDSTCPGYWRL